MCEKLVSFHILLLHKPKIYVSMCLKSLFLYLKKKQKQPFLI
jgi:hypothetical protein